MQPTHPAPTSRNAAPAQEPHPTSSRSPHNRQSAEVFVLSTHAPKLTTALACRPCPQSDHRGRVHRLSLLFQPVDGRIPNRVSGQGKTLGAALTDIFTLANFMIAIVAALIGYVVFETLPQAPLALPKKLEHPALRGLQEKSSSPPKSPTPQLLPPSTSESPS